MGKLNEIQEQTTQSWGSNSFTTKITDQTVEFDSAKDSFTFMDEVNVPALKVNGQTSVPFTEEEKAKLDKVTTPMNMKGRVDNVSDLPTQNVAVGDTYLVGPEGSENFEEYVCTALEGSPATPVWENIGHIKVQPDWNQNNSNAEDFIKNRTHYVENTLVSLFNETLSNPIVNDNLYIFTVASDFEIVEGSTYKVTVDGIEHSIESSYNETLQAYVIVYGDMSVLSPVSGSYIIAPFNSMLVASFASDSALTSVELKIETETEIIHTLDEKFIPSGYAKDANVPVKNGAGLNSIIGKNYTNSEAIGDETVVFGSGRYAIGNGAFAAGTSIRTIANTKIDLTFVSGNNYSATGDYTKYYRASVKKVADGVLGENIYDIMSATYDSGSNKTTFTIMGLGRTNTSIYVLPGSTNRGAFSEGEDTYALGEASHSEGYITVASGYYAHSEGYDTVASGDSSHSEGYQTVAAGKYSHSEGYGVNANHRSQHTFGEFNVSDPSTASATSKGNYVEIVGNGTSASSRSNARTLDWSGNEMLAGTLTIGGASGATIKVESGALKVSFDGGTTWLTISAS